MPEEEVLRLQVAESTTGWEEAKQRVHAERLVRRPEVADAPERVRADEDSLLCEPDRDLAPEAPLDDRENDEGGALHFGERRLVERDAELLRDQCVVASMPVEELDDGGRGAERRDALVEPGAVDDVGQPDPVAGDDGVRGARELVALRDPLQPVLELGEIELHGKLLPVARGEGTSNAEIADRLDAFASLLDLAGSNPYTSRAYRRAAEMIRETKAPVADLVRAGRARELRGIGPGIEARMESFHSSRAHRYGKLKRVGDTALFVSGIFMESVHRKLVSSDYYMQLGRTAYAHLSTLSPDAVPANPFAELAERFPDFVRVLSEISFRDLFRGDVHMLRVYTRWMYTRSESDARWLMRHGITPHQPRSRGGH